MTLFIAAFSILFLQSRNWFTTQALIWNCARERVRLYNSIVIVINNQFTFNLNGTFIISIKIFQIEFWLSPTISCSVASCQNYNMNAWWWFWTQNNSDWWSGNYLFQLLTIDICEMQSTSYMECLNNDNLHYFLLLSWSNDFNWT